MYIITYTIGQNITADPGRMQMKELSSKPLSPTSKPRRSNS